MRRISVFIIAALLILCAPMKAQEAKPKETREQRLTRDDARPGHTWTKVLPDRTQRGKLHDSSETVRGDSGRWQDEPLLLHAPPIAQKPAEMSLDDWADQLRESDPPHASNGDNWLLFRTRQLDDNDHVWVERIERRGNQFTLVVHEAVWQGRYSKNFTYYDVLAVNLGKLEPGKYEAKCLIQPLEFKQLEGPTQPRENWPNDDRLAETKAIELRATWTVSSNDRKRTPAAGVRRRPRRALQCEG